MYKMKLFITIFLILYGITYAQFSSWQSVGKMNRPVAGGDIWENDDQETLFVLGGYSDSVQSNVNWIQSFNADWGLDSMSTPRFGLVTENYNNQVLFFGGVSDDINSTSGIERWGPDFTDESILNINSVFNRIFSVGHIIEDNFYIIGGNPLQGTRPDTLAYIVEYNVDKSEVTFFIDTIYTTEDLPEQQFSEVIGENIYIFGGVINGISQDIFKFNTIAKSLEKLSIQLLEPRAGGRAVKSESQNLIYIIGGYNESLEALNSVEVFHVWGENDYYIEAGPSIINARYNFMSGKKNGDIYIMGGFDSDGNVLETIEMLDETAVTEINGEKTNLVYNDFELHQNYPNPFNPTTKIEYEIPTISNSIDYFRVQIVVYDIIGNEIAILGDKEQSPGKYSVVFDASTYSSGIYYYQLKTNSFVKTKKMILIK